VTPPTPGRLERMNGKLAALQGIRLILCYLAVLATIAFLLTLFQPGGSF